MKRRLDIDFVQMPWSGSAASWRYHSLDVWNAVQDAVQSGQGLVKVCGEASASDNIAGMLTVSGGGFKASVTVSGGEDGPQLAEESLHGTREAARRYFQDMEAGVTLQGNAVTAGVRMRFPEQEKGRMDLLLRMLWELQLFALQVGNDAFAAAAESAAEVSGDAVHTDPGDFQRGTEQ